MSDEHLRAADLARDLAALFLNNGNYESQGAALGQRGAQAAAHSGIVPEYLDREGFAGLSVHSVGYTAGADSEEVLIYVTRGSRKALAAVEDEVDGIRVRARLMGRPRPGPAPAQGPLSGSYFFERNGRVACGSSCAPSSETYSGTLGAIARDARGLTALSNNHVFGACNHTPVGMPILAPSAADARPGRRAPTAIGLHERVVELRSGAPDLVPLMTLDVAVARIQDPDALSSWQGDSDAGYDTPSTIQDPLSGMRVRKFGRTTGLTVGEIEALVPTPWVLPYKAGRFAASVWFHETWTIRSIDADPFALAGDSGSLIVTDDATAPVGLLFAVNSAGNYAIFMPIRSALAGIGALGLVSNHGV